MWSHLAQPVQNYALQTVHWNTMSLWVSPYVDIDSSPVGVYSHPTVFTRILAESPFGFSNFMCQYFFNKFLELKTTCNIQCLSMLFNWLFIKLTWAIVNYNFLGLSLYKSTRKKTKWTSASYMYQIYQFSKNYETKNF